MKDRSNERSPIVSFLCPDDIFADLEAVSADEGVSRSDVVRKGLRQWFRTLRREEAVESRL